MAPKKTFNPLAARIKRMMQRDEDVGKIANGAPVVLARAMELFVKQLTTTTCDVAVLHGAKTIQATHLKGAIAMVPEAFDFLSDVVETVADLPPPPDLNAMEAELKEKEMDDGANGGGGGAGGKRKKTKASGGSLEMGSLGGFGGSLDDVAAPKKKTKATSGSKKSTTSRGRRVKKEEYDDEEEEEEEEEDFDDLSETDEEFDPDAPVPKREPTRSRSGRTVRKRYTDDFVEEEEEEEEKPTAAPMASFDAMGSLGGAGTLDAQATEIGADEDDYD
jgi:histone H3/H4